MSLYFRLFQKIEALATVLKSLSVERTLKQHIFHQQQLKSSLFSARIEGNTLSWDSLAKGDSLQAKSKSHQEITNVVRALQGLPELTGEFDKQQLLQIHNLVMTGLDATAGKLRYEPTAIYDQYGMMVYLTPLPAEMHQMLAVWLAAIKDTALLSWQQQLLQVAACHYYFEKIHPFIDGNGRTGRVVMHYQLSKTGLFTGVILPIDQYFDEHRSEYYAFLEKNTRKLSDLFKFFLTAIIWSMESCVADFKQTLKAAILPVETTLSDDSQIKIKSLFPRRKELYYLIQDHPFITLESLARRFPTIPQRTLAYDVNQLVKAKLIIKHGTTKGVMYSVEEKTP